MKKTTLAIQKAICPVLISIFLSVMAIPVAAQFYLPEEIVIRINQYKRTNAYDKAMALLDSAGFPANEETGRRAAIEACIVKADLLRLKGYNNKALVILDSIMLVNFPILISDSLLKAELLTLRGTIRLTVGDLKKGKSDILEAIDLYSSVKGDQDTLLGPCFNKLGNYYYFAKNNDSAMICYTKAITLAEKKKNNLEERASYLQNRGIVFLEQGDYNSAELSFLASLTLKESLYPPNSLSLGRLYLNMGRFYEGIYNLDAALYYLNQGEQIYSTRDIPSHIELGKIYWNKGLIYYLLGDYEMAITYLYNARQIIDSTFNDNAQLISSLNADIGNIHKSLGEYDKAIAHYKLALDGNQYAHNVKTYRNLANLYFLQGDYEKSAMQYRKLIDECQKNHSQNSTESALTYRHYGELLTKMSNDSALFYLEEAYNIFMKKDGFHRKDAAATLFCISDYYGQQGDIVRALEYVQLSLVTFSRSFIEKDILLNPQVKDLFSDNFIVDLLTKKAGYLADYHDATNEPSYLFASCGTYLLCMDMIDQLRSVYRTEYSQLQFINNVYKVYHQAIKQFIKAFHYTGDKQWLEHAFTTSERGKAMILLNELRDANARRIGIIPESSAISEKEIKKYLSVLRNELWEEDNREDPDSSKVDYLRSRLLIQEKLYDSLMNHFQHKYPAYYKLKYDQSVISVDELKCNLRENELLVEYTLSDDILYIFTINQKDFEVYQVEIDTTLIKDIFCLRDNLNFDNVPGYSFEQYLQFQELSHKLFIKLVEPFYAKTEGKKLIFIPDGELNYLSFESLIREKVQSDTINFKDLPYLLTRCPVSYAASATTLSILKKGRKSILNKGVLAIAPSYDQVCRQWFSKKGSNAGYYPSAMELPGAVWEAQKAVEIMDGKNLVGFDATETEFKKHASSYNILHFATHTSIDDDNPLSSKLTFFPFDMNGEDGVLQTYEIYGLDLKGELAVLSACSSGNGKLQKGEGVISLARAFAYAGMPSVVMTLWDVDDISSGNIIADFYFYLRQGIDKDDALRYSKLNYLHQTYPVVETHPAFWSGIVLYGNSRGFRAPGYRFYLAALIVLGGLIIFVSFKLINKYKSYKNKGKEKDFDISTKFRPEDRV